MSKEDGRWKESCKGVKRKGEKIKRGEKIREEEERREDQKRRENKRREREKEEEKIREGENGATWLQYGSTKNMLIRLSN